MDTVMVGLGDASVLPAGLATIVLNHVQRGMSVLLMDQGRSRALKGLTRQGLEGGVFSTVRCVRKGRFLPQLEPQHRKYVHFANLEHI